MAYAAPSSSQQHPSNAAFRPKTVVTSDAARVARFYDWSPSLTVHKYRNGSGLPLWSAPPSNLRGRPLQSGHQRPTHRLFSAQKHTLTKGEQAIVSGIYQNRGDLQDSQPPEGQVQSHQQAWIVGKSRQKTPSASTSRDRLQMPPILDKGSTTRKEFEGSSYMGGKEKLKDLNEEKHEHGKVVTDVNRQLKGLNTGLIQEHSKEDKGVNRQLNDVNTGLIQEYNTPKVSKDVSRQLKGLSTGLRQEHSQVGNEVSRHEFRRLEHEPPEITLCGPTSLSKGNPSEKRPPIVTFSRSRTRLSAKIRPITEQRCRDCQSETSSLHSQSEEKLEDRNSQSVRRFTKPVRIHHHITLLCRRSAKQNSMATSNKSPPGEGMNLSLTTAKERLYNAETADSKASSQVPKVPEIPGAESAADETSKRHFMTVYLPKAAHGVTTAPTRGKVMTVTPPPNTPNLSPCGSDVDPEEFMSQEFPPDVTLLSLPSKHEDQLTVQQVDKSLTSKNQHGSYILSV